MIAAVRALGSWKRMMPLPAFLRYLRDNGYRVVHVVPAGMSQKSADAH